MSRLLCFALPSSRATTAVVGLAALAGLSLTVAAPADAAGTCVTAVHTVTCTFAPTGAEDTFAVPAGVTSVDVTAVGAAGATGLAGFAPGANPSLAGRGGTASATVTVTPGSTLYVEVGGTPTLDTANCYPISACIGGFNGGGTTRFGGGGGGASDVRTVPAGTTGTLASRLVVAGGGGGGGEGFETLGGNGGDAGANGTDGGPSNGSLGGAGGTPGTGSAGGAGGASSGGAGALGLGGGGGGNTGGAGGGGYYGGGGGGNLGFDPVSTDLIGAGGGGGGSSFAPGGTTGVSSAPASVVIVYTVPTPPDAPTGVSGAVNPATGQVTVSWTAPTNTNGAPITTYSAVAVLDPTKSCTATAPATSCVITGLPRGRAYTFTVTATNAAGPSVASAASASVTLAAAVTASPTPVATASPTTASADPTDSAALAATGQSTGRPLGAAVALLIAGVGLLVLVGRRRPHRR